MSTPKKPVHRADAHIRTCPECSYIGSMGIHNVYTRVCPKCKGRFSIRRVANHIDTSKQFHVFTSAVAECGLNKPFFDTLVRFTQDIDAQLHVLPLPYRNSVPTREAKRRPLPPALAPYISPSNMQADDLLLVLAEVHVVATAQYPLTGLGVFGQQDLQVLGHPAVQLKPTVRALGRDPRITVTTGAVTRPRYSDSGAGAKAKFHHVDGALLVELDVAGRYVNCRHLLADKAGGFFDLDGYWTAEGVIRGHHAAGLVVGDLHASQVDQIAYEATFEGSESIRGLLKPQQVVLHDVHDGQAGSHHNKKYDKLFLHYAGKDSVLKEAQLTVDTLIKLAPCTVVPSNHDEHLQKWLDNPHSAENPKDFSFYTDMWAALNKRAKVGKDAPSTLAVAFDLLGKPAAKVRFLELGEALLIKNIDCAQHGDKGHLGQRGSLTVFRQYATKMIVGHAHFPGISGGCHQVGALINRRAVYSRGHSTSSMFAHTTVYANGKRAMLFIRPDGRWFIPQPGMKTAMK